MERDHMLLQYHMLLSYFDNTKTFGEIFLDANVVEWLQQHTHIYIQLQSYKYIKCLDSNYNIITRQVQYEGYGYILCCD